MRIVCWQTILRKYHTLFFSKNKKDVAVIVVCCSCDWRLRVKAPAKSASEIVVCSSNLLHMIATIFTYISIEANSVDPDQTAPMIAF